MPWAWNLSLRRLWRLTSELAAAQWGFKDVDLAGDCRGIADLVSGFNSRFQKLPQSSQDTFICFFFHGMCVMLVGLFVGSTYIEIIE